MCDPLAALDDDSLLSAVEMTDDRCLTTIDALERPFRQLAAKSIFVVADPIAYGASGAEAALAPLLRDCRTTSFRAFEPNPKLADVESGLRLFREAPADVVVAVGGGTAIDVAKLIAAFGPVTSDPRDIILRLQRMPPRTVPLIAVPTTSGTGSEATQFAVVYVDGVKHSVDHPCLMPAWCVLDPLLTARLPPSITAHSGLDAFCQGVESLWSSRSTPQSVEFAAEAIRLALQYLPDAVHLGTAASRAAMSRAAHLAGRAINITRTTAPHALSYAITSDHGVPHGHAVALTLGPMLLYNSAVTDADANDPRGASHTQRMMTWILELLECTSPAEGASRIDGFIRSLGCESRLSELGVAGDGAFRSIARQVNLERLQNNPRRLDARSLLGVLESIA